MTIRLDRVADAAYMPVGPEPVAGESARQVEVEVPGGSVIIDLDEGGRLIGVEVLGASSVLRDEAIAEAVIIDDGD